MAALRLKAGGTSVTPQVVPLTAGLAAAAITELLILRTFTRTAIHIPAMAALQGPYDVLAFAGRYAYFVSLALLIVVLPALLYSVVMDGRRGWRFGGAAIGLFAAAAGAAAAGIGGRMPLDLATLLAVVSLAAVAAGRWRVGAAAPFAMLALTFVTSGGYTVLQSASQQGADAVDAAWMLTVAEYAGVLFALSLPLLAAGRIDRVSVAVGAAVGALAFVMFAGAGASTSRILLLWNEGLSGTLPGTVYAVCAGALAASFAALVRSQQPAAAVAVALLAAGGVGLHSTYQSGLVVAGLALLCLAGPAGRTAPNGIEGTDKAHPAAGLKTLLTR